MPLLFFLNGYLTIIGLVVSGVGSLVELFLPETGPAVRDAGLMVAGLGQLRRGVLQYRAPKGS